MIPSVATSASPLSRMLAAIRVKSPFSHSALFGLGVVVMARSYEVASAPWSSARGSSTREEMPSLRKTRARFASTVFLDT